MKRYKIILVILYLTFNCSLVLSQEFNPYFKVGQKTLFSLSTILNTPSISHNNLTKVQQGFSISYSYPGFFSYYGQANLCYSNYSKSSFYGGVSIYYLMLGANLNLSLFKLANFYLNFNFGRMIGADGQLGSIGLSYVKKNKNKEKLFELAFDIYFHHGASSSFAVIVDVPYLRGVMTNIYFSAELRNDLFLNYGIGLSFIQYKYNQDGDNIAYYVTYEKIKRNNYKTLNWDSQFIIPLSISLSYHF